MTRVNGSLSQLSRLSVSEAARLIAEGTLSCEELVRSCLARIDDRESVVHAWAYLDPQSAIARAEVLDSIQAQGPLHGVPFGVKDIFDTAELPTAYGSAIYQDHRPEHDSAVVAALREAGALVLGKTVTTEFAYMNPGPTKNPHNLEHTPGGSSSGSAAAVADCMVPFALGSQTGGSTIRPAAFCGIFGFKPTYGFVSSDRIHPLATALDTVGWFARSTEDLALIGSVLSTIQSSLLGPAPSPLRVGIIRTSDWHHASPAAQRAIEVVAAVLDEAGVEVRDLHLPDAFDGLGVAWETAIAVGAASAFGVEYGEHKESLSSPLIALIEDGRALGSAARSASEALALHCRAVVSETFSQVDVFLTPSAPGEAPYGIGSTGDPLFNRLWTLLRLPCVNIPAGEGDKGLPVGVQLVGRHGGDQSLLEVTQHVVELLAEAP